MYDRDRRRPMSRDARREIARAVIVDGEDVYSVAARFDVSEGQVRNAQRSFSSEPAQQAEDARLDAALLDEIADALDKREASPPAPKPRGEDSSSEVQEGPLEAFMRMSAEFEG